MQPDRTGAGNAGQCRASDTGVTALSGGGDPEGAVGREACLRVVGADGDTLRGGAWGGLDGDRPGATVRAGVGDSRGGAQAGSRQPAGVSPRGGKATGEHGNVGVAPGVVDRGRAVLLPVELPGLSGRGNRSSSRGGGGGAGAQGPQPGYGRSYLFERRRRLMDDWASYLAGGSRKAGEAVRSDDPPRPQRRSVAFRQGLMDRERPPCPYQGLEEGGRSRPPRRFPSERHRSRQRN